MQRGETIPLPPEAKPAVMSLAVPIFPDAVFSCKP